MKKFLRDLLIAFVGMTIVLFILWNISWITEWKQVLLIYGILGAVMPDFDLLIELAKYYDVEVGEILDGERRTESMDAKTEETMLKIADYNNTEKNIFSKRMQVMFIIALAGMVVYAAIDLLGLSGIEPYETIISIALGFVTGTLLTGILYTSRYIIKIRAAKMRLIAGIRRQK